MSSIEVTMEDRDWKRRRMHETLNRNNRNGTTDAGMDQAIAASAAADQSSSAPGPLAAPHARASTAASSSSASPTRSHYERSQGRYATAASATPANGASGSAGNSGPRQSGEKRSRRGCQTCKNRRKKCPEDFVLHSDGNTACSTCFQKGLACHAPLPSSGTHDGSAASTSSAPIVRSSPAAFNTYDMPPPTHSSAPLSSAATGGSAFPNGVPAAFTRTLNMPSDAGRTTLPKLTGHAAQNAYPQPAQPNPVNLPRDISLDSSWLDDFFKEFSSLSDPIYQDAIWLVNGTSADAPVQDAPPLNAAESQTHARQPTNIASMPENGSHTRIEHAANPRDEPASSKAGHGGARTTLRNEYDRIVQSHELDLLLERYSSLYEQLWHAVFTTPHRDDGLTRAIMALSRSSKSCRASTVALCLSYHHIMQRERAANRRANLGLSHFLMAGEPINERQPTLTSSTSTDAHNPSRRNDDDDNRISTSNGCLESASRSSQWPATDEGAGLAYKWHRFALEEYKKSGREGSMEQRLNCLLNLRWTIIALDGGNAGRVYMDDIRATVAESNISLGYVRHAGRQGTVLSLILQSAMVADIFDAAAAGDVRCAVRLSPTTLTTPSMSSGLTPMSTPSTSHANRAPVSTPADLGEAAMYSDVLRQDMQNGPLFEYEFTSCLSLDITECILLITNLVADIREGLVTSEREKKVRSEEVLNAVQNSQFGKTDLRGAAGVRAMALHEMWRHATLILFYQSVLHLGPLAAKVQHALNQILSLADMLSTQLQPSETWDMWMPWMLASSVAVLPDQRAKCMRYMEGLGSEQAMIDNIRIIRYVWQATDDTGHTHDWSTVAKELKLGVCWGF